MSQVLTFILILALVAMILVFGFTILFWRRQDRKQVKGAFFESSQGPIYYNVHGNSGQYVLLIHGLGCSSFSWRKILPFLSHRYRVITFDLWGFGFSSKDLRNPMTLDTQIEVIQELLAHLKVKKFHVVGHSMGAQMALWLKKNDSRVEKCIAITPAAHPGLVASWLKNFHWIANWTPLVLSTSTIRRFLLRTIEDPAFLTEDMVQSYYEPYIEPAAHLSFAAALNVIRDPRVYENLHAIQPDLVVWAAKDAVMAPKLVQQMSSRIALERMVTHPTAGHLPMEDDHQWLGEVILRVLKS